MDPNETLKRIRELAKRQLDQALNHDALELAGLVEGLDNWLQTGGFLPDDWSPWPANRYKDYDDHTVICRDCSTTTYVATIPIDQTAAHDNWHIEHGVAAGQKSDTNG